jgi:hypothetical protein
LSEWAWLAKAEPIPLSFGPMESGQLDLPKANSITLRWIYPPSAIPAFPGQPPTKLEGIAKIIGMEKVTVPAGTYDALVVNLKANMSSGSVNAKIDGKTWYVKDIGMVQQSLVRNLQGQSLKIMMRLKKVGS